MFQYYGNHVGKINISLREHLSLQIKFSYILFWADQVYQQRRKICHLRNLKMDNTDYANCVLNKEFQTVFMCSLWYLCDFSSKKSINLFLTVVFNRLI